MPATQLFLPDGKTANVWFCSNCNIVYEKEADAIACHEIPMCACGKPARGRFYTTCTECDWKAHKAKEAIKELEQFDKAAKVTAAEYQGERVFWNDVYYDDWVDAIDSYLPGQQPEFVWAAKNVGIPLLDISGAVESLLDELWEDADESDLIDLPELQKAVDAFNEANRAVVMYMVDYSTAILIPQGELTDEQRTVAPTPNDETALQENAR